MKASNSQIITIAVGLFLLFTFPPGFILFALIVGVGYLAKHLNPYAASPRADQFMDDNDSVSPTQQTLSHLKAYWAASAAANQTNGEKELLSDQEQDAWNNIVKELNDSNESK